jgi:hypothetical protein
VARAPSVTLSRYDLYEIAAQAPEAEARFLRRIRDDACRIFGTVLSPDYNAVHADHLHLEATDTRFCR